MDNQFLKKQRLLALTFPKSLRPFAAFFSSDSVEADVALLIGEQFNCDSLQLYLENPIWESDSLFF